MSIIKENFDKLIQQKELPADYMTIEGGHHLYRFRFGVSDERDLIVEVIIQNSELPYADAQVIYRHVHLLKDYGQRAKALETMNELNEMRSGYYSLFLAGDGEIFLRNLMRLGADPQPLYETIVYGSSIAKDLVDALTSVLGESGVAE